LVKLPFSATATNTGNSPIANVCFITSFTFYRFTNESAEPNLTA
jgi:hypothetical protein